MPVGQEVTATSEGLPEAFDAVGAAEPVACAGAVVSPPSGVAAPDGAPEAGTAGLLAAAAGSPSSAATRSTTSWSVSASRSALVNAGLTSARASLVRIVRWSASPPAGAAIRKARSAGPSLAPKSTRGSRRANARVGTSTPVVRQWGIAMPPGSPVAEVDSRAKASSMSWSRSTALPALSTTAASARITSCLSEPQSAPRVTRSVVMSSVMRCLQGR